MTANQLPAGWGRPSGATRAHYYQADETFALCGKWWYAGAREHRTDTAPDNCPECRRVKTALRKKAKSDASDPA